ncbi:MAG TPA: IPT/TIG domain-containing protein, partial [Longimicrobium sp.]|nr:IPT/TIG domain-containing protein [Longimicrobium sp.]
MPSSRSSRVGRFFRAPALRGLCAAALAASAWACGDGGTPPEPKNPTPGISSIDPARLLQWSDSATITVTGSGFVDGIVARVDGSARLTRYVSPSQLTFVVQADRMQQAGSLNVTVVNPAPGGGESAAMPLPVEHRVPDLLFLEPAGAQEGGDAFVLTVNGAGFAQGSVVRWNGADRPTTFVAAGRVTAQIPASDLAQVGTAQITVFNPAPGGGTAAPRVFTISARPNPVPQLAELSPATIVAGTGATFTITGTGFVTGAQVFVGGFTPATTVVS